MQTKAKTVPQQFSPNWMQSLDGRTAIAQELRGRYAAVCTDLGGEDNLSYMQRSLVTRALWLEFHLQQQEELLATGEGFDSGKWVQAANALQGIWAKLGLERKGKEISLAQFIKRQEVNK